MKAKKILVGFVSLFALTGCGEVEPEKFQEELSKVEEHSYSSATVKYSYDVDMLVYQDKGSGEIEFKFENGKWTTSSDDKNASDYVGYLAPEKNVNDAKNSMELPEGYANKVDFKYYTNPFKIKVTYKDSIEEDGAKGNVKVEAVCEYNKYAYPTLFTLDFDSEVKSGSSTIKTYMKEDIRISYKD